MGTMEGTETIQQELFNYVRENTYKDVSNLEAGTMLFIEGILDSMGFALLLDFLEEKFAIKAQDSDLVEENFESVQAITKFIQKKQQEAA